MESYSAYLIKSSVCLTILFLYYMAVLRKDTFYQANRFFLLLSVLFSLGIPLISFPVPSEVIASGVTDFIIEVGKQTQIAQEEFLLPAFSDIVKSLYITGSLVFLFLFINKLTGILLLISRSDKTDNDPAVRILKQAAPPFSFFTYIFIPESGINSSDLGRILRHEQSHVSNLHSLDLILIELLIVVQWFNPAVWLLRKELIAQHEFIADKDAIGDASQHSEYGRLLLSYSLNSGNIPLTNNFSSLLKRRLNMLNREKTGRIGTFKFAAGIPLFLLLLWGSIMLNNGDLFSQDKGKTQVKKEKGDVYTFVEDMPQYPGGTEKVVRFIASNVVYPEIAKRAGIEGKVLVGFIVEKDGSISDIKVEKGVGSGLDEEAVRVTRLMEKWIPGKHKGKPVKVRMVLPFQFKLQ